MEFCGKCGCAFYVTHRIQVSLFISFWQSPIFWVDLQINRSPGMKPNSVPTCTWSPTISHVGVTSLHPIARQSRRNPVIAHKMATRTLLPSCFRIRCTYYLSFPTNQCWDPWMCSTNWLLVGLSQQCPGTLSSQLVPPPLQVSSIGRRTRPVSVPRRLYAVGAGVYFILVCHLRRGTR